MLDKKTLKETLINNYAIINEGKIIDVEIEIYDDTRVQLTLISKQTTKCIKIDALTSKDLDHPLLFLLYLLAKCIIINIQGNRYICFSSDYSNILEYRFINNCSKDIEAIQRFKALADKHHTEINCIRLKDDIHYNTIKKKLNKIDYTNYREFMRVLEEYNYETNNGGNK